MWRCEVLLFSVVVIWSPKWCSFPSTKQHQAGNDYEGYIQSCWQKLQRGKLMEDWYSKQGGGNFIFDWRYSNSIFNFVLSTHTHTHTHTHTDRLHGGWQQKATGEFNQYLNWKELDCHHRIIWIVNCGFSAPRGVCVCLFRVCASDSDETGYSPPSSRSFQFEGHLFALSSLWQAGRENATVLSDSNYLAAVKHLSLPLLFASTSFVFRHLFFPLAYFLHACSCWQSL